MTESKKEWVTPELIVLTRSKPEEVVLSACKSSGVHGAGGNQGSCMFVYVGCVTFCSGFASS